VFSLSGKWLWEVGAGVHADAIKSMGMLLVLAVAVLVLGLVARRPPAVLVGGVIGLATSVAFAVTLVRSPGALFDIAGIGLWLALVGGVLAVVSGLMPRPSRHR
jgi:hypothetical protein